MGEGREICRRLEVRLETKGAMVCGNEAVRKRGVDETIGERGTFMESVDSR